MRARGYSIVELVLVVCMISTLLAIVTLKFGEYAKRYRSESQTRMLYTTLLKARADALYQRRGIRVKLYANTFEVYSSACDDCDGAAPVQRESLAFPVSCNAHGNGTDGYTLDFDARGMAAASCSICVGDSETAGAVDSLVMSTTRVNIGKREAGDDCKPSNIIVR